MSTKKPKVNEPRLTGILPTEYGERFRVGAKVYTFLLKRYDRIICMDGRFQTEFYTSELRPEES